MIYDESEFKGHYNFRLRPATAHDLKGCPFCGKHQVELQNTHTPHYWMECQYCGCEIPDPKSSNGKGVRAHRASALRAIEAWQHRA
jgi:hypothetical protein